MLTFFELVPITNATAYAISNWQGLSDLFF